MRYLQLLALLCVLLSPVGSVLAQDSNLKPIRALLIAGGCCHDYANQQQAIRDGIQSRANVRIDVYWTDNSTTTPVLPLYTQLNWAEEYDVIIHDECAADIKDPAIVNRIVQTHQKLPAVHLHCAMHSFRTGTDAWFKHLGLQSSGHGPQEPIEISFVDTQHPITSTLSDWTTIREELYNNVKVFDAHPLAVGKQAIGGNNPRVDQAIVAWTNESQGARSFSTTIGHNTETVRDPRYLELITRGLLWSCDKLTPDYLTPYQGEQQTTFIDKEKYPAPDATDLGELPADATLVKVTASSTQSGNLTYHAVDGKPQTRWCADGDSFPQWIQLEFAEPVTCDDVAILWESNRWYRYTVTGSLDGQNWSTLLDRSDVSEPDKEPQSLTQSMASKFVRITGLAAQGGWCSIREIKVSGKDIGTLWPADPKADGFVPMQADRYAKQGNVVPKIVKLSPREEAEILRDVRVPDGFEATVFASPPAVNYPVFVAASVDGTLFVSSDGNGSLGRDPGRGRVIRLRDLDGDGRADETKVFCTADAPRGLVWDHDRLYLMHPPNLSVFIDHDDDGVADEQKTLVRNLAFGYDKRPADHTTNGVSLGADGWLYIAGGDFGFMNATGTDGRTLTHRGGGVIRVRPDGTGLEVYSTGTRNILEVAISPEMDMFARDNTNDGGGWDVRLHHFTGNEDHGYPRLYKNFNDECVQPLADYGGGSGCGAVYIDEPGFGRWNDAPLTADWGTGALYRHTVEATGATFQETAPPESFIKMTRPTDADVDGNSRVYCASWRGATFNWNGPDVGYIVCVKPKGYQPPAMPDFASASDDELVELLSSQSYRRRVAAQRELMRRGNPAFERLLEMAVASRNESRNRLAMIQTPDKTAECISALSNEDPVLVHTAIRVLAKNNAYQACFDALDAGDAPAKPLLRALAMMHDSSVVDGLITRLSDASVERRSEILKALCRLHFIEGDWKGDSWGTRPDTRGPYYQPESWSETPRIAATLQDALKSSSPENAASLVQTMHLNRIKSDDAVERLLTLAEKNPRLLGPAVAQLAASQRISEHGIHVIALAIRDGQTTPETLSNCVIALTKSRSTEAAKLMLVALAHLDSRDSGRSIQSAAINAITGSRTLEQHTAVFVENAEAPGIEASVWADAALLVIASRNNASPEMRAMAEQSITAGWKEQSRRKQLIRAAVRINNHSIDEQIWLAQDDPDTSISELARSAVRQLKIQPMQVDDSPKIGTLSLAEAAAAVMSSQGDVALGQRVFVKANCTACHSLSKDEVQKGPFLGNIAKTYKRHELAAAVLEPSKTIAQGFATNSILTVDGEVLTGFVTDEQSDRVTIRDQQAKERTILKDDIEARKTVETSVMPTGLMNEFTTREFASLLDFLSSLTP
ncbi:DUF7133 domain-containing protein [Stieleria varia]|uniref:Trehalose utilization n=1 Tax=Stieleria varia TaxID=2528005 RepID=A0A5C5ZWL9_9BACT|nr:discoidin domain-containing protein [Stieleria varia]TWT91515.1 Trehalose utilization [Stieleria varia]